MDATLTMLRALKLEELMALDLDELATVAGLSETALAVKKSDAVKLLTATKADLDAKLYAEEEFAPKIIELFASQPVKLNVGGTYFATSLENLTREPNTFFSILCGGKWDIKLNPKDDAVFIDRSPVVFGLILDYLRTGTIDLDDFTKTQLKVLGVEADFYQISSLLARLNRPKFLTSQIRGNIKFSELDSVATNEQPGEYSWIISMTPFSPITMEMSVKIVAGKRILIGVAPRDVLTNGKDWSNCGWYMLSGNGTLYGCDGKKDAEYGTPIKPGSIVTVKLDKEFNINFAVDGGDWGVAYEKVATDFATQPLYLCVSFDFNNEDSEEVVEGVVQLVD